MNSFQELITKRRSIRKFTDEKLKPEQVESILKAALKSPSSKSKTPWQFVVVEDREQLQKLSRCKEHGSKPLEGCSIAIIVLADPLSSDVWIEDASIASILIQLEAEDLGLGSCWIQIRERFAPDGTPADNYIREIFDIPLQLQVLSVIAIGHKAQERSPFDEEKLQWERVHIGKYTFPE